ncbi:putative membrane protein YkvI [Arcanobacterium wilhelmae]|uniref:Membrane protein YkvI n=1 Tax=Arcanobacterium wilhelmae TaxID=1803177 RepID=A0ABT9NCW2_9ACTO|nr:hypothetical protein [Arcanobacterium wilhelmae]MDP9801560.1 putative membrane protein YkvI [Arcanobacterium wilhelmae]WFN90887.1 hypothetical protein P8A24_03260 [Arcanobacterium wilhelmae]
MIKQILIVSSAFIGLVVGAGFASGQEVLQYFVAHGTWGIAGAVVATVMISVIGVVVLQLGSYFLAKEHSIVYDRVAHPIISRLLDVFTTFVLFCMGVVMLAGAGANLNQQFGIPNWLGGIILALIVFAVGFLDTSKVTTVIGAISPFIIALIIVAAIYAFTHPDGSAAQMNASVHTITPAIDNWILASLNYVGMNLATAVAMALVMGGNFLSIRVAGWGGAVGGTAFGGLVILTVVSLFVKADTVKDAPMPMLKLVDSIHPAFGTIMSVVIFGMIFNTAIGMFYALSKRATVKHPRYFNAAMAVLIVICYGVSFVGFETLVNKVFPIVGWVGLALAAILTVAWVRSNKEIRAEAKRRKRIRSLLGRMWTAGVHFSHLDRLRLRKHLAASNIDDRRMARRMSREVVADLQGDDSVEVEDRWEATEARWDEEREKVIAEAAENEARAAAGAEFPSEGAVGASMSPDAMDARPTSVAESEPVDLAPGFGAGETSAVAERRND